MVYLDGKQTKSKNFNKNGPENIFLSPQSYITSKIDSCVIVSFKIEPVLSKSLKIAKKSFQNFPNLH